MTIETFENLSISLLIDATFVKKKKKERKKEHVFVGWAAELNMWIWPLKRQIEVHAD